MMGPTLERWIMNVLKFLKILIKLRSEAGQDVEITSHTTSLFEPRLGWSYEAWDSTHLISDRDIETGFRKIPREVAKNIRRVIIL